MLPLLIAVAVLCAAILVLLLVLTFRWRGGETLDRTIETRFDGVSDSLRRVEQAFQEGAAQARRETNENAGALREELSRRIEANHLAASTRADEARREAREQMEGVRLSVDTRLRESAERTEGNIVRLRAELTDSFSVARNETRQLITTFQASVKEALTDARSHQGSQLADFSQRLRELNVSVTEQMDKVRQTLDLRLNELLTQNAAKLDEMRQTVDQRLQATLEQRLGESFKIVNESLERVSRGLGEMQEIASGVGDLKRVLTNVKTRGTWGEVQLSALLEQVLTADQFAANIAPNPASGERVEFAIKLPGRENPDKPVWLPIDAKFPVEDYQRLVDAAENADVQAELEAGKALEARIRGSARDISTKYVAPPYTTDFGILYLPTEGLYAEALRRPGLAESLQREHRIVIAGPTTLAALLNSLQMGFRTLAIQQRSSEVWSVLGAVKTEFGKFAEILSKVKKKLDEASTQIDQTGVRSRAIERRLRSVESLPADEAARLLPGLDTEPSSEETPE
ncbi:MAG: DNA recombination protein RmuC [Opitutaceae bacterium]|nr:DNA recombination protein RmuC [Opitutaceae bacterium]